jgi:uncharacterized protein
MEEAETSGRRIDQYAAGFMARMRLRSEAVAARTRELRTRATDAARALLARHGACRVWLFGSLAWGQTDAHSDVDLLIEGLSAEEWDAACATVEEIVRGPVDLVRAEDAAPGLVRRVRAEGVLLDGGS